ncbi:hypothetical protein DPMN_128641 [Dreissena polymorpha]|uniref:Uncharacterized protein n=1 Tax=Dreissena polymorpha TaxID=45954 RepID=A0A9D4JWN1_DREPO|nr:hypothetical protein DPMN_128641 [Dreissena polymorpha]
MSLLYMSYQLLLFCSSLLTPSTIFLLITGALNTAFPAFDLINSLVVNAVPVALFMVTCFFCEPKWQVGQSDTVFKKRLESRSEKMDIMHVRKVSS